MKNSLIEKLEIVLITYNRKRFLERTLLQLFEPDSPVKDLDITVLDNNSTDGTDALVCSIREKHANLKYVKNHYNIGGNGNIAKAMETGRRPYLWVLCDDDAYDWSCWSSVERAIESNELVISLCGSPHNLLYKDDLAYKICLSTYLPSIIFNTQIFTDTTMRNVFDNIFCLFPHLVPVVTHVNHGGQIHMIEGTVVVDCEHAQDTSYARGTKPEDLFQRSRTMSFAVGFCNILANLKDRRIAQRCFEILISGDFVSRIGYVRLFGESFLYFGGRKNDMQMTDLIMQAPWRIRLVLKILCLFKNLGLQSALMNSWLYRRFRSFADRENSVA